MRLLSTIAQLYVGELVQAKRPIAAMEFMRNLIKVHKQRVEFDERFTESRIVTQQVTLYQLLKQYGEDPNERWELIKDVKTRVEQLSPNAWEDNALRTLRDERAQIIQYYAAEEGGLYKNQRLRPEVLSRLIESHEEVLQLESGLDTPTADQARSRSLRAICNFKEEQGSSVDYQVYAQELHSATMKQFKAAGREQNLTVMLAYDTLSSHVMLCKAYARAKKWDYVVETATDGLELGRGINWDGESRAHVEFCQLLVYRSRAYLKTEQPRSSLDDARDAVHEANSIPWNEMHPNQDVNAEYPAEYQKYRWQNFAQLNLIDTLYDRQVIEPDEQFGLIQALHGLQTFTPVTYSHPEKHRYEAQYRSKKIRALRKLERWHDALADCRDLLAQSAKALSSSDISHLMGSAEQIVRTFEDAADCLEKLGKADLAARLLDEADLFAEFSEDDPPLESYPERGAKLQEIFNAVYEEAFPTREQITMEAKQIGMFPFTCLSLMLI